MASFLNKRLDRIGRRSDRQTDRQTDDSDIAVCYRFCCVTGAHQWDAAMSGRTYRVHIGCGCTW